MKKILIDQPGYLGDIIYVMAIAQKYALEGYDVIFPVFKEYISASGVTFQKNFPTIKFIFIDDLIEYSKYHSKRQFFEDDNYIYLPCRWSPSNSIHEHMKNKYNELGFSFNMWRNIIITRDFEAESRLFIKLNIAPDEKFNLINKNYSNREGQMIFNPNNDYRNILMSKIEDFNLFDWMGVIEKASSIHTVHTSIQYILDIMPNITTDLHIYPRIEIGESHSKYNYLFTKKYIYH